MGEVYLEELIYWIGYMYWCWHYVTGESNKKIYKQALVKVMKQNYARLPCRQGADLRTDVICKLVPFFVP